MHVNYEQAEQAIAASIAEADTLGTQMCIAVVDVIGLADLPSHPWRT